MNHWHENHDSFEGVLVSGGPAQVVVDVAEDACLWNENHESLGGAVVYALPCWQQEGWVLV